MTPAGNLPGARRGGDDPDVDKDVTVRLRLSAAEAEAWRRAADAAGLTLSEWIRRRVTGAIVVEAPAPPKRRR